MGQPQLSILVPAIPSRFDKAKALVGNLIQMIGDKEIEVLMLLDNKKMTVGEKRDELKNICRGKYFMFVDDDDDLYALDNLYQATFQDVDVITFKQRCLNSDKSTYIVTFGLGNPVEHNLRKDGMYTDIRRPPWHVCAWHQRFAKYHFPAINYSEDWEWLKQVLPLAKTEIHLDEIVAGYNWDPAVSEASTASNPFWTNPEQMLMPKENKTDASPKRCIVTLATGPEKYTAGLRRQVDSLLKVGWLHTADAALQFYSESEVGAPEHENNPYAFKLYAIHRARQQGYDQILWADASIVFVKHPAPVFDWMEQKGVFMEEAGHWTGKWANDSCLTYFSLSREDAMKIPMFSAGYCGFDFRNPKAVQFFDRWGQAMLAGAFRGSWSDHRHDMTCGSIVAHQLGMTSDYSPGGHFFAYIGEGYGEPQPTVVGHLIGL